MALSASAALGLEVSLHEDSCRTISPDEELVCVAETDACCVDAVQILLGCTLGKGNLLLKLRGKTAMTFYHRPSQSAVRAVWQADVHTPEGREMSRDEKLLHFLTAPEERLLRVYAVPFDPPSRALISRSLICAKCGELTAEYAVRLHDGAGFLSGLPARSLPYSVTSTLQEHSYDQTFPRLCDPSCIALSGSGPVPCPLLPAR